jgi:hypothetical protein
MSRDQVETAETMDLAWPSHDGEDSGGVDSKVSVHAIALERARSCGKEQDAFSGSKGCNCRPEKANCGENTNPGKRQARANADSPGQRPSRHCPFLSLLTSRFRLSKYPASYYIYFRTAAAFGQIPAVLRSNQVRWKSQSRPHF